MSGRNTPLPDNRAFYDRISLAYDLLADASEHQFRERGEAALAIQPGETVLEIGVGTGNSLLHLAQAAGPVGTVRGLDVSSGMLDVARRKLEKGGLADRVDLRQGDAREMPYQAAAFDACFLSFTLELFDDADLPCALAEIRRVLKPGGRLAVVAMAAVGPGEKESILERGYEWMHRHFPHIVDCRPIDSSALLEEAGFDVVCDQRFEMWTMPVSVVVATRP